MKRLLLMFLLIPFLILAQPPEYSYQVVASNNSLKFPAFLPILGTQLSNNEGSSSIANSSGNLLYYSDGVKVWNGFNVQLPNGFGLLGNNSTTQSCIIVKQPGNNPNYYIFTAPETSTTNNFSYSIIDHNVGDIVSKNNTIAATTESLSFAYHCNGVDIWIITKFQNSNSFSSILLTSTGLQPSVTSTGGYFLANTLTNNIGCLKLSPNGAYLAINYYGVNRTYLYDFNSLTGAITNERLLNSTTTGPYGLEFSGNSRYLFVSYNNGAFVHRYDVTSATPATTRTTMATNIGLFTGSLQLIGDDIIITQNSVTTWKAIMSSSTGGIYNSSYYTFTNNTKFGLNQILYPVPPIITNINSNY